MTETKRSGVSGLTTPENTAPLPSVTHYRLIVVGIYGGESVALVILTDCPKEPHNPTPLPIVPINEAIWCVPGLTPSDSLIFTFQPDENVDKSI